MYLAVPVLLYACERLIRAFRSGYKTVRISKVYPYSLLFVCLPWKLTNYMLIEKGKLSGCCVSWKCSGITNVKASWIQIHKWAVHICELFCNFSLSMVNPTPSDPWSSWSTMMFGFIEINGCDQILLQASILDYVGSRRWLPEHSHSHCGRLDFPAQDHFL